MVFPKGRFAAVLLTGLLALPPSAAPAQCQQHSNRGQTGMSQMGQGRTPFMSGMMSSMSQMSMMQSSPMQWFSLQQGQQLHLQQMQMIAMQQQMQQTALQQARRGLVQQPSLPPAELQAPTRRKQFAALLQQMQALEKRLTGLEEAAQRHALQPPQAGAVQNELNALQSRVDALTKAPNAVLDQMSSLHRRTDQLLEGITAKPADVIAAERNSR